MRALAVLACLCFSLPAQAFVHAGGPHFRGGHPGHHYGFGGYGLGVWGGDIVAPQIVAPVVAPAPVVEPVPVPYCPRPTHHYMGSRIIYIGAKPVIHGPEVIYGTD